MKSNELLSEAIRCPHGNPRGQCTDETCELREATEFYQGRNFDRAHPWGFHD